MNVIMKRALKWNVPSEWHKTHSNGPVDQFVTYRPRYSLLSTFLTIRHDCTWTIEQWRKTESERETAWGGLMVSASRMGLLDSFGMHWAECASNNGASGPHSHFNLCNLATACTPMLWLLCCRGCESGYNYSAYRWVRKQRFHYSILVLLLVE